MTERNFYGKDIGMPPPSGEEFKISRLFADLLSTKICQMHTIDPTCNIYILNTKNSGDFSKFLNLINFQSTNFLENELPFFLEIIDLLGTNSLEISELMNFTEITNDNIFPLINKHQKYGKFYSKILKEGMTEFESLFDINDITVGIWKGLAERLTKNEEKMNSTRYKKWREKIDIPYKENQPFSGIIKYLKDKQLNKIEDEINITHSSVRSNSENSSNVTLYERNDKFFCSKDLENSWICFEFKNHQVILTDYIIKTITWGTNWNPKSWIVEGSLDGSTWETLNEQKDCPYLKKYNYVHKFTVSNQSSKSYRFIRFSQTGPNWAGSYEFSLRHLELYGSIITSIQ